MEGICWRRKGEGDLRSEALAVKMESAVVKERLERRLEAPLNKAMVYLVC